MDRRLAESTFQGIESLELAEPAATSAAALISNGARPTKAKNDALYVSLSAANGVGFLTTWNMRHLANVNIRRKIEKTLHESGYIPPAVCTPEELLGENYDALEV